MTQYEKYCSNIGIGSVNLRQYSIPMMKRPFLVSQNITLLLFYNIRLTSQEVEGMNN